MDLDGDGFISMYEMEYFYEEQVQKMEALGIETLPFEDCLCQVWGKFTLHGGRFQEELKSKCNFEHGQDHGCQGEN